MKKYIFSTVILCLLLISPAGAADIVKQPIKGAGPSTAIVKLFAEAFNSQAEKLGYRFLTPPDSVKHAGGIENSDNYLFGRTGRPLKDSEKQLNKGEISLARIPIAFAVGPETGVTTLTLPQLEAIFTGKIKSWSEVGGSENSIELLGRESSEALFLELKKIYPFFAKSVFEDVYTKDNQVVNILNNYRGVHAIGFGAKPNFINKGVSIIEVDDFSAGVSVGLVYDLKNADHPVVKAAKAFAKSQEWATLLLSQTTSLPPL